MIMKRHDVAITQSGADTKWNFDSLTDCDFVMQISRYPIIEQVI